MGMWEEVVLVFGVGNNVDPCVGTADSETRVLVQTGVWRSGSTFSLLLFSSCQFDPSNLYVFSNFLLKNN